MTPTTLTCRTLTPPPGARHPLASQLLIMGSWHGPLEWCGAILGPAGFLVFAFADQSQSQAEAHLLEQLNRRLPGWTVGPLAAPEAHVSASFAQAQAAFARFGTGVPEPFHLPLDYQLGTPFQQQVWQTLKQIPWGTTVSYGELASRIGRPQAARAVGNANGANVLAPVVPCHRVIQADGTLGGYGGGLPLKQRLLRAEGVRWQE
ncbi:MAG: Methylated-DNA--protein-cysteine methyltransferase [bacterium]|nr:Methylated-DNA--protein-cysteine methyltransferase [bacterium]